MKIILGSESRGRREIMERAGYVFDVIPAHIDEKAIRFSHPSALTLALALAKRDALLPRIGEPALLITSDQVVVYDGAIREKPVDVEEAERYLRTAHLLPSETVTAVAVTNTATGRSVAAVDTAKAYFRKIPEVVIAEYIRTGDAFTQSGGFDCEHPLIAPYVARLEGERESMVGLPIRLVRLLLEDAQ